MCAGPTASVPKPARTSSGGFSRSIRSASPGGWATRSDQARLSDPERAAPDLGLRHWVRALRDRVPTKRVDSLAALAHEDVSFQSQPRRPGLHGAGPARTRPPPAASGAALARGKDASAPQGGTIESGTGIRAGLARGDPPRRRRCRVRLGTSAQASERVLPGVALIGFRARWRNGSSRAQ